MNNLKNTTTDRLANREGQQVPEVTFRTRNDAGWKNITSGEIFSGKSVILFALPGAFTPTCSATHLPRYEELAEVFASEGVDEIICLAVNDGFIMHAWAKDQGVQKVTLLPDGNGDFSRGMGMLVEKNDLGFGSRSWRYAMHVVDGEIKKMFIEDDVPGDPFEVSGADTMLNYMNPNASLPETVAVITRVGCPYCDEAKAMLSEQGLGFNEIHLGSDIDLKSMRALTGASTVPQVFIGGKLIGGAEALKAHFSNKK